MRALARRFDKPAYDVVELETATVCAAEAFQESKIGRSKEGLDTPVFDGVVQQAVFRDGAVH